MTQDEPESRRPVRGVVAGRRTDPVKVQRARDLRQAMTPAETQLWAALRGNQVRGRHFRRQQVIAGFIVDFYCHAAALVVEVDGEVHATQADYDTARDTVLRAHGLRVLRIANAEIARDLPGVVARIAAACNQPNPPNPPSRRGKGGGGRASRSSPPGPARRAAAHPRGAARRRGRCGGPRAGPQTSAFSSPRAAGRRGPR